MLSSGSTPLLAYWVAARPLPGQSASGDQHVVVPFDDGVLVAVIDGLGHGASAHAAAMAATRVLHAHAHEPLADILRRCHEALRKTRGAVMSLASFRANNTVTWLAIGNVDALLVRATPPGEASQKPAAILPRGGIVGDRLPPMTPATLDVRVGDLLLMATDGIASAFVRDVCAALPPDELVQQLFLRHARENDDALLLGAQWINGSTTPPLPQA